jgi:GDPmannose 4,6-dehydratase
VSKVAAHQLAEIYRNIGIFVACGIMFNHESPRRGDNFVTKKIAVAAAKAYLDIPYKLELGNLDAVRDWGFAPAYVEVMWKMLQQDRPETYVVGTGESHTVRDLLAIASLYVGKPLVYSISNQFIRPLEVDYLQCKPSKISDELGWSAITTFYNLVRIMVDAEIERLMPEKYDADGYRHFKKYYGSIYRWL